MFVTVTERIRPLSIGFNLKKAIALQSFPQESLQELQSLFEATQDESQLKSPEYREALKGFLGLHTEWMGDLFALISQNARLLPAPFFDLLGNQIYRLAREDKLFLEDGYLDYLEEFLLRSQGSGRWDWLALLALLQSPASLSIFVREVVESNQFDSASIMKAFAPLMQQPVFDVDWIFPDLFQGLHNSELAPVVVDFSNYCLRAGICDEHPGSDRAAELTGLLESLSARMQEIESDPTSWSKDPHQISKMISDSVALIVSLCDALALMYCESAVPVLQQVMKIRHRRIRAEAAFALARFEDDDALGQLLTLVEEPVSRLRVLQYADELGLMDRIDEKYTSPESLAESEIALWLSQPSQMGVAPSGLELVDKRSSFWPGYDEPVDCFLFRFAYQLGENEFTNIAISGPLNHAFVADLQSLTVEDSYAAFAGWQVEHESIVELDLAQLSPHRKTDQFKLERKLNDYGCSQIETRILALFFGEIVAVAECQFEGSACIAFTDGHDVSCFKQTEPHPLTPDVGYCILKGRKLLEAFNV